MIIAPLVKLRLYFIHKIVYQHELYKYNIKQHLQTYMKFGFIENILRH